MIENIDAQQLKMRLDQEDSFIILDCRDQDDFEKEHIDGSLHLLVDQLENEWNKHFKENQNIVVICNNGHRSIKACQILNDEGLENIFCLRGGLRLWKEAGFPTQS